MAYERYTIRQFEKAWLYKDYSAILEDIFQIVYNEYVDTTGAYVSSHFDKIVYIRLLQNRINTVNKFIQLQTLFVEEYSQPYTEKFDIVTEFGYSLKWNNDKKDFLEQLESIKSQESSVTSDLQISIKEYNDLKEQEPKQEIQIERQKIENWMNSVNSLIKLGYTIDKDKMMLDEMSYIIKYEKEQMLKNGR